MTVTVATMFISVHDPAAALGFYRDALGLEVRNDVTAGDFRWVTVGAPGQDLDVVLSQPHGGRSQVEGDARCRSAAKADIAAEVCIAVGCTSLGSFSSRFTEIVGETPSRYRARDHSDLTTIPPCVLMVGTRPRRQLAS
jgi:catechol 2,3-dioxygenase-like lactoylglutathione lyase family enzyme